jgi:hypothetical protein
MLNNLGIDVYTKDASFLRLQLGRLKATHSIEDGGMYWMDKNYSQIHITTVWNEEELDNWLYKTKHHCKYIGTFSR